MGSRGHYPDVDPELVRLKAAALQAGHLKMATWGSKAELERFARMGEDPYRGRTL